MTTRTTELDRVIAANILFYRIDRRWTQQRLAAALGISFQQLTYVGQDLVVNPPRERFSA